MEGKIVEDKKKVLFHLFISTLYLSAFTFGGGYVIVSLLKKKFVDEYHWIENDEILLQLHNRHREQSQLMERLWWDINWRGL